MNALVKHALVLSVICSNYRVLLFGFALFLYFFCLRALHPAHGFCSAPLQHNLISTCIRAALGHSKKCVSLTIMALKL